MAFGKKFFADYKSYNGYTYHLEIWADGWAGQAQTEINLGDSYPRVSYDTSGSKKFTEIYSSKLSIPFIVDDAYKDAWIKSLITSVEEKEIYCYLWRGANSQYTPIFAGFLLMDLSSYEDVFFPYEAELTATDGMGLLKEIDFVRDGSTPPYEIADTFIGDGMQTYIYWISLLLNKVGLATTAEGNTADPIFTTSVNWYNKEMDGNGQADDPLAWTRVQTSGLYKATANSLGVDIYTTKNCYQILVGICRMWGMRCIMWKNRIRFIQVGEYNEAEVGTVTNPNNINTRSYTLAGAVITDYDNLGSTWWTRYQLEVDNTGTTAFGIEKLATTKYEFFPKLKNVIAEFLSVQDYSYYQGFPSLSYCAGTGTKDIGTFIDADQGSGWWLHLPLSVQGDPALFTSNNITGYQISTQFTIRCKEVGTTYAATGKQLTLSPSGTPSWITWVGAPATLSQWLNGDMIHKEHQTIMGSAPSTIMLYNGLIPTHPDFVGAWEFQIFTSGSTFGGSNLYGHGAIRAYQGTGQLCPGIFGIITNDIMIPNSGFFAYMSALSSTGAIGNNSVITNVQTATTDSHVLNIGETYWGDGPPLTPTALQVYDGANWIWTDVAGGWGKAGLTGTRTITELLCDEVLYNQQKETYRANWTLVMAQSGKTEISGGGNRPRYINPIGRIKDQDNRQYVFGKGTFNTGTDEWRGAWFGVERNVVSTTTGNTGLGGVLTTGTVPSNNTFNSARLSNSNTFGTGFTRNEGFGRTTAELAGGVAVTSLSIVALDKELFVIGDKIDLIDLASGSRNTLTIAADQTGEDTSLTIDSFTPEYTIREGAFLVMSKDDLYKQYQHQTHGSVAAFEVDADGLTKGGIEITSWLDSDTMTGASANSLATSESIKAYVDASIMSEFLMATCTSTVLTSATNGELNAVTIPFNTSSVSGGDDIVISTTSGEENNIRIESQTGTYQFHWNVKSNTSVVNNRVNCGVKLQIGDFGGEIWTYTDLDPSHCYIYNRANGSVARLGGTSGSILVRHDISEDDHIYRLVFWKDTSSNSNTKGITVVDGTQMTITKIT